MVNEKIVESDSNDETEVWKRKNSFEPISYNEDKEKNYIGSRYDGNKVIEENYNDEKEAEGALNEQRIAKTNATNFQEMNGATTSTSSPSPAYPVVTSRSRNSSRKLAGFLNLGNTCYINSCIQALYLTNKFRDHLFRKSHIGSMHYHLSKIFKKIDDFGSTDINSDYANYYLLRPDEFINEFRRMKPQFVKNEQHDAQEFLSILLETIHQEANQVDHARNQMEQIDPKNAQESWRYHLNKVDNSIYSKLFMGQLQSTLKCLACDKTSLSWTCFWQLTLHLNEDQQRSSKLSPKDCPNNCVADDDEDKQQQPHQSTISIESCLNDFTSLETLSDDCAPFCERCNCRRTFSKQQTIVRAPHYLIIHLKRFTQNGSKINQNVLINSSLVICDRKFSIYSCVLHRGTETMGHYFTLAHHHNKWFMFDDEKITKNLSSDYVETILKNYSYICFYRAVCSD